MAATEPMTSVDQHSGSATPSPPTAAFGLTRSASSASSGSDADHPPPDHELPSDPTSRSPSDLPNVKRPRRPVSSSAGGVEQPIDSNVVTLGSGPLNGGHDARPETGEADRYQHIMQIGRGGWGVVDRAIDQRLGREVAVKRLRGDAAGTDTARERFLHEAKITSRLQHPGIVPVHELESRHDRSAYYVMKLLKGETFRQHIQRRHAGANRDGVDQPRSGNVLDEIIRPLLERFIDVCQAVGYAHDQGVIHRDLKPANIMVGAFGETVVLDWGLAIEPHEVESAANGAIDQRRIVGTPAYMSPEQAAGDGTRLDHRSDIYSLGVILHEIIVGRHPYVGLKSEAILRLVRDSRPPGLQQAQPATPRPLLAIVAVAMSAKRDQRYSSAVELANDVRCYLAGEKVSVHADSIPDRIVRWTRKHQTLATTVGVAVLMLLVASTIFGFLIHQSHRRETAARVEAQKAHSDALRRLIESRDTADAWLVDLSGSLQFFPGLRPLRSELIERAIVQYQKLVSTPLPTTDSRERDSPSDRSGMIRAIAKLERAKCHLRLCDLYRLRNDDAASDQHRRIAHGMLDELQNGRFDQVLDAQIRLEQANVLVAGLLSPQTTTPVTDRQLQVTLKWLRDRRSAADNTDALHDDFPANCASAAARLRLAAHRAIAHEFESAGKADRPQWAGDAASTKERLNAAVVDARWLSEHRGEHRDRQLSQTTQTTLAQWVEKHESPASAIPLWHTLLDDLLAWSSATPRRADQWQAIGHVRMRLAEASMATGSQSDALQHYEAAIASLEKSCRLLDSDGFYRTNLASAENHLGRLYADRSDTPRAEALLKRSLVTYQELLREDRSADRLRRLAQTHLTLGELLRMGDAVAAERHLRDAQLAWQLIHDHGFETPSDRSAMQETQRLLTEMSSGE